MSHTKGPWTVQRLNHADGELWLQIGFFTNGREGWPDGKEIGPIAELKYLVAPEEEQWANARLIASAPDLLEVCEVVLDWLPKSDVVRPHEKVIRDKVRNAVRKARGE